MLWHNTYKIKKSSSRDCRVGLRPVKTRATCLPAGRLLIGFTLIEVMVAATVLSLGTVLIHEIFFRSLELANYSHNYLNFAPWLDEKLWQAQNSLSRLGKLDPKETKGKIMSQGKDCEWSVLYNLINSSLSQQLYKVNIVAFWQEGQKKVKFQRTAFAIYEKE